MIRRFARISPLALSVLLLLGLLCAVPATRSQAQEKASVPIPIGPDLIAVRFHADWCGACRTLAPKFDDVKGRFDEAAVLFVTLDLTSKSSRRQAEYLAAALGIGQAWQVSGLKTGQVFLVEPAQRKVVAAIAADESAASMRERIEATLASR